MPITDKQIAALIADNDKQADALLKDNQPIVAPSKSIEPNKNWAEKNPEDESNPDWIAKDPSKTNILSTSRKGFSGSAPFIPTDQKPTTPAQVDELAKVNLIGPDGKHATVAFNKMQELVSSGQYKLLPHTSVNMVDNQTGEVFSVDAKDISSAGDARLENPYETATRHHLAGRQLTGQNETNYAGAGPLGSAQVAGRDFLNDVLFGVPETIAEHYRTPLEQSFHEAENEQHSTAHTLGRVAGFAGNVALTAGAGSLLSGSAESANALRSAATEGARIAIAEEAPSFVSKALSSTLKGAATGAAYSSPVAVTQLALGDTKAAAETMGIGLLTGGLIEGGGSLIGSGLKAAKSAASPLIEKLALAAEEHAGSLRGQAVEMEGLRAANEFKNSFNKEIQASGINLAELSTNDIIKTQEKFIDHVFEKSKLDMIAGAKSLDGEIARSPTLLAQMPKPSEIIDELSTSGVLKHVEDSTGPRMAPLRELVDKMKQTPQLTSFEQLNELKAEIHNVTAIRDIKPELNWRNFQVNAEINNKLNGAIDNFGKILPDSAAKNYFAASTRMDAAQKLAQIGQLPSVISQKSRDIALGASSLGGELAEIGWKGMVNPTWGAVTGGKIAVRRMMESASGKNIYASVLENSAAALQNQSLGKLGKLINNIPATMIAEKAIIRPKEESIPKEQIDRLQTSLRNYKADPTTSKKIIEQKIAPITKNSPQLQQSIVDHQTAKMDYLATQLPNQKQLPLGSALKQQLINKSNKIKEDSINKQFNDMEMTRFNKAVKVAEDPFSVINKVVAGTATNGEVDALKSMYPEIHQRMVAKIMETVATGKVEMNYQSRLKLGLLIGEPLDLSTSPQSISMYQNSFNQPEEKSGDKINLNGAASNALMSDSQKLQNKS